MKLLIVDDESATRVFFRKCAERWGDVEVDEALDGDEALMAVMRRRYDLITVDLSLGRVDSRCWNPLEVSALTASLPS